MPDYMWMKTGQPTHGEGESPNFWYDGIEQKWGVMEILHTTGIHKQVGDPKKVRKKGSTFCPPKKGDIGELTFFSIFFPTVEKTGNSQMITAWYKTYLRCFGGEMKKKSEL